jgi:hypothetical protein
MFTLQIPLKLIDGKDINLPSEIDSNLLLDNKFFIYQKKLNKYIHLYIENIASKDEGDKVFRKIRTALILNGIDLSVGFEFDEEFNVPEKNEDPILAAKNIAKSWGQEYKGGSVDYLIDEDEPNLFLTNSTYRVLTGFAPKVLIGINGSNFLKNTITNSLYDNQSMFADEKLMRALRLFNSHFYESTYDAKFIRLIVALETLLIPEGHKGTKKTTICDEAINILRHFGELEENQLEYYETSIIELYNIRNVFIHEGKLDYLSLKDPLELTREIAGKVLKGKIRSYS